MKIEIPTPARKYRSADQCIYCGATEYGGPKPQKLGDEHIVPKSLGGRLILPNASCWSCETKTTKFEKVCARDVFGAMRHAWGMRRNKKHRAPDPVAVSMFSHDDERTRHQIEMENFPATMTLPLFAPPTALTGEHSEPGKAKASICIFGADKLDAFIKSLPKSTKFAAPSFRLAPMQQLIAKVAHSYAVAEFGLDGFEPYLLPLIHGENEMASRLVGGERKNADPANQFYEIHHEEIAVEDCTLILVHFRLFSFHGTPWYRGVVGRLL